ncbi:putative ABC transporter ATP-binding protein YjjK [Tsuneonella dongtanensis]|uniref:Putative ABC transporter ATP-binding protein YjjK n=1 Tax=Tsuneonella dongtanensis TaxID=692370 RepID=A0A1B2AGC7_9SPHN|nr:putative ABC transporter ATP-binding protein YjjK [Tsuneonella dongtanensis]
MAAQYAYVMKDMTKTFPGAQKPVLSNINLQFYQGAKIGIVGPNGAGKSTLIKIMAGIDKDFTGEAWPGENITVGYLEQEPELDESKTVLENVKDGARATADMVERFNAIGMEMAEPDADHGARGRYRRSACRRYSGCRQQAVRCRGSGREQPRKCGRVAATSRRGPHSRRRRRVRQGSGWWQRQRARARARVARFGRGQGRQYEYRRPGQPASCPRDRLCAFERRGDRRGSRQ